MLVKRYLSSFFLMGLLAVAFLANAQKESKISSKTIDDEECFVNQSEMVDSETLGWDVEVVEVEPMEKDTVVVGGYYVVEKGEDLYDIAKKFGIDLSDFKEINPGLNNNPSPETKILVPNIVNEQDYIIHKVEYNERATSMLKRWKVKEKDFREKNISVGSHVFVNQIVLIPIEPVIVKSNSIEVDNQVQVVDNQEPIVDNQEQEIDEPLSVDVNEENENLFLEEIPYDMPECIALPENALKRYNVALMIPLYLYDLGSLDVSKENISKLQKARPLSFLQYYQGFMMAAEKLEKEGLKLNLTVIDVTDNVSSAHQALSQIEGKDFDMIVGPFFAKSFEVIEEYARDKGIIRSEEHTSELQSR